MSPGTRRWLIAFCLPLALKAADYCIVRAAGAPPDASIAVDAIPLRIGKWSGQARPVAPEEVQGLGRDALLDRVYAADDGRRLTAHFIYSARREGLHLPENCLVSQGFKLVRQSQVDFSYGQPARPGRANLVVAATADRRALVELYVFADQHHARTGWGGTYLDMLRRGRAGGEMTCLLLLTSPLRRQDDYPAIQTMLTEFMAAMLPHVQRSLGASSQA